MTEKKLEITLEKIHVSAKGGKLAKEFQGWGEKVQPLKEENTIICGYSVPEIKAMTREEIAAIPLLDELFTMIETEMEKYNDEKRTPRSKSNISTC